ncbi:MAG: diacylglycerol kinase [Rickettsiales bacterium]|nr:diacylglycerol kinase [Rickettsiales bacterium]
MERLWRALCNSISGLRAAFREEMAFRQEVVLGLVLAPIAYGVAANALELALLWGSLLLVMVVELLNSAVEAAVDRISKEIHPLAKKAKDTASAAVLLALINAVVIWGAILLD